MTSTGYDRSHFDLMLKFGEKAEGRIKDVFDENSIEVKDQRRSDTHVFIEHWSWGKPGGIAVTKADWWGIEIADDRWMLVRTETVRELYEKALRLFGESKGGEPGSDARGASVPKLWLVERRR